MFKFKGASAPTLASEGARPSAYSVERLRERFLNMAMFFVLVALMIASNVLSPGYFESGNLQNMLSQNAPVAVIAIAMTFAIIAGGFDLSVGAIVAGGGILFATLANDGSIWVAFLATLGMGAVAGAFNGFIVTKLRVNPFIATLGTASLYAGLINLVSESSTVMATNESFGYLGRETWLGLKVSIWLVIGIAIAAELVLSRTVYGRQVYAVGGNIEAARLAGMRVDIVRGSTFLLTGAAASLAGMLLASVIGVGQPGVGANLTLNSIAIVIIGGTTLLGGEGAIWRTIIGLLIFATINNLFASLAWPTASQQIALGAIVIIAVSLDSLTRSRRRNVA